MEKVIEIAQTHHDRLCMSSLFVKGQVCKCCENICSTTTSIEHDSMNRSKDLSVCSDCYSGIVGWWIKNKPGKIPPI